MNEPAGRSASVRLQGAGQGSGGASLRGGSRRRPAPVAGPVLAFLSLALSPGAAVAAGDAEGTVCAEVKIEIEQQLTLERQAFDAHMKVVNGLASVALENVTVDVFFRDADGNTVTATSDPDDENAEFFIRVDRLENIDTVDGGTIAGGAEANMHWLIVPSPGAAAADPNGTLYFVGAELSYDYGDDSEQVSVTPDSIRVKPMPALTLDYFLPRNVDADDPLTDPIEPAIPFTLGVRVLNSGDGPANNLSIESAQPEITENEQGLPIDFRIIDSRVDNEPRAQSLKIDFGDIPSDSARNARWRMETTYSGRFTDFGATFTHADEFGGELTSLLDATRTHQLVGDVLVDAPGRDAVKDFLAYRAFPANDDLRVYESNATDTTVTDHSAQATLQETASGPDTAVLEMTVPQTAGFAYAKVADPFGGAYTVDRVVREDGKVLPDANAWFSTAYLSGGDREHHLHLFDVDTPGTYTIEVRSVSLDPGDPVIRFIPDKTTHVGAQLGFLVEAGDAAGNEPALSMDGPGLGETFEDNGDGTGFFNWTPDADDVGSHTVTFTATRGDATTTREVAIQVYPAGDTDGDGLPDEWEMRHFGTLERDGSGDYSGDGISDRMAYQRGLDPTRRYNQAEFRAQAGTVIVDDAWSELPAFDAFNAPVVITGPGTYNDTTPGVVQVAPQDDGSDRIRFREWPHEDGGHGHETVSYLAADPGSYVVDQGSDDDLQIEVGTFQLDEAGQWSAASFQGTFPGTPTVLTTVQRDAAPERPLATRVRNATATGFEIGAFHQRSYSGDPAVDVTVGYIAIFDENGAGALPLLDSDVDFQRFTASLDGAGAEVAGTRLRRQTDGSLGGDPAPTSAEPVGGIAFADHVFADSQQAGDAAAATIRRGTSGGESIVFNFARPSHVVSGADDAVTLEIVRSGNTVDAATVELDTIGATAVAGRDFVAADGRTITFDSGEKIRQVDLSLLADGNDRPSQAFRVALTPAAEGARTADPSEVLVTVVDGPVTDADGDGMADVWETHYFDGTGDIDGSGDQDGDGTIDRRAFLEGLDPTAGTAEPAWLHWRRQAVIDGAWQSVSVPGADGDEILIAGVTTAYGDAPGAPQVRRSGGGVEARFRPWGGGEHGAEQMGLLAVDPGRHPLGQDTWEADSVADVGADTWRAVSFNQPFDAPPHVLTTPQGAAGDAGAVARVRNVTTDGFEVRLVGTAADSAIAAETVGYLAIGGAVASGTVTIGENEHDYRVGRVAVDHTRTDFANIAFRLQPGAGGGASWPVEMVDALAIEGTLFARDATQADSGAVNPRRPVPRDADDDGLADRWELAHGLDPGRRADAVRDHDDDGASTLAEYVAGTDPQDALETPGPARVRMTAPLVSAWATRVPFGAEYDDPIVISGAPTDYDPEPGVVRLDFIGTSGARARFAEWAYLDGVHGRERAPLLTLEAGRHLVDGTQVWEAGRNAVAGGGDWTTVEFARPHDKVPRVVATPQDSLGKTPRIARVRNVTREGFEVALFAERGGDTGTVDTGQVGWIAASPLARSDADTTGYIDFDGTSHRFRLERASVDHTETLLGRARVRMESERSLDNGASRAAETVDVIRFDAGVFAQDVTFNDATPGTVRRVSAESEELMPSEAFLVRHGLDPSEPDVEDLDVSGDGFSVLEEYIAGTDIFDPDDSPVRAKPRKHVANVNDQWNTATFARHYEDPVVLAGAATANEPDPGVVQLTGLASDRVDVRFAEWSYLKGDHGFEDVPLLVMDAGRHLVDDTQVWEVGATDVEPGEWTAVTFDRPHEQVPQVLATTQTANSDAPVVARVRNVTESGFEVAIFGEAGGNADDYIAERVGYLAASGTSSDGAVDYGGTSHPFSRSQAALTDTATEAGGVPLRMQGEASATPDTTHDEELVDVLVFDGAVFGQDVSFNDAATAAVRRGAP